MNPTRRLRGQDDLRDCPQHAARVAEAPRSKVGPMRDRVAWGPSFDAPSTPRLAKLSCRQEIARKPACARFVYWFAPSVRARMGLLCNGAFAASVSPLSTEPHTGDEARLRLLPVSSAHVDVWSCCVTFPSRRTAEPGASAEDSLVAGGTHPRLRTKKGPRCWRGPGARGGYFTTTGISFALASSAFGTVTFNTPSL